MMEDNIPKFELDISSPGATANTEEFQNRIVEFISKNISGEIKTKILCYFVSNDGTEVEAKLPIKAYRQALSKSLEFFTEVENYEKCKTIKELTEKL